MGNKGQIAGILSIVSGVFGLLGAGSMILVIKLVDFALETDPSFASSYPFDTQGIVAGVYGTIGIILAVLGILGIIGGAYSIKRKYWGLGLAAAIAGIITFFPCGVAAIILIAIGKPEFDRPAVAASPVSQPPPLQ